MIKWLLVIGVVAAVYYMFIKKKESVQRCERSSGDKRNATSDEAVDEMVECSVCGIYVEIDDAIVSNGKYYCSRECLQKG